MRNRLRLSAALAMMLAAGLVPLPVAGAQQAQQFDEHQVDTVDNAFVPATITVTEGDTVNWVAPQTNLEDHTVHAENERFDGALQPGQTFSHRFTAPGTYEYHCDIHPTEMSGTVVVQSLQTPVAPEAPTDVVATAGSGSATLTWSPPAFAGGSAITGYTVTASPGGQTETVDGTTTSATITGLTNGTSYTFEVEATNEAGTSPAATSNAVTPIEGEDGGPCPEDTPPAPFTDRDAIPAVHRENVDCATALAITNGRADNTYGPAASVRRDQMASFIARSLDAAGVELPPPSQERFTDVTPGSAHDEAIHRLAAAEIVLGGAGGQDGSAYGPTRTVRRDQMASFLLRAAQHATQADLVDDQQRFPDVGPSNAHFLTVNGAFETGLAQGSADGSYRPDAGVRRDQMGTFVVRLVDFIVAFD